MAVNVLYDLREDMAVLYCSTSDWAFGPVFYGDEADEKAISFRDWFHNGQALARARELGIQPTQVPGGDGDDPRDYHPGDLERLYSEWRSRFTDSDGNLIDTEEAVV